MPSYALNEESVSANARGKSRPRILLLDHTAVLSGAELALLRLVRNLDRSRFEIIVALFSDGPLVGQLRESGIEVHVLALSSDVVATSRHAAGGSLFNVRRLSAVVSFVFRLARFMREQGIDLVHTNSLKSDLIGGAAAFLAWKRSVWHVHDRVATDYMPGRLANVFRLLSRAFPDYVIANSKATLDTLLPRSRNRCSVIYPGVSAADFPSQQKSLEVSEGATIGLVGRISPTKGQDVFLRASRLVLDRFPKTRFQIIGAALFNYAEYEKEMRQLAGSLGVSDAVEFTGFCDNIEERIANLDILVHASTTPEPFGQVAVEGMMAGKAVVATDAGGIPEIVIDEFTGLLVPMGDAEKMAAAICRLLENPELARRMGALGRQRVAEHFAIERTARKVEDVYDQILS